MQAKGWFEVRSTPHTPAELGGGLSVGRMRFEKEFHGDLEGTGVAEMTGLMFQDLGSGGYVAMERIAGALDGRNGSFCLQHSSTMDRGKPRQSIQVVPDSGKDGLSGIGGSFTVEIVDGKHYYVFDWELTPRE